MNISQLFTLLKSVQSFLGWLTRTKLAKIPYVIKSLRSSGFKTLLHISKTSSAKSLNMGKLVTEEIRHKIISLKQAKFSYPAICKQLNLKNASTNRTIWNTTFVANGTVLPKSKSERPKNCQNAMNDFC